MKKITVLLAVAMFTPISVMAYLYEDETTESNILKMQGYSNSTIQVTDWVNYRNKGIHSNYVRYFVPKDRHILGRAYQRTKVYLDPIQDDGYFGEHSIEFSNTWMGDEPHYASDLKVNKQLENL